MNKQEHEAFLRSIKQSQQRSKAVLARMQGTRQSLSNTINEINETTNKIDEMKRQYNDAMDKLALRFASLFMGNPLKKQQGQKYQHLPQKGIIANIGAIIQHVDQILIITGAGVSVDSGIPTFRGQNGLYSKKFQWDGQKYSPQQFITKSFYNKHPQAIWNWINEIYNLSITKSPNQIHYLIDQLALELTKIGKKVTLVTQNIDDLHIKPKQNTYNFYAVHGNVKHVRCQEKHLSKYSKQIIGTKCQTPNCTCVQPIRPHVLFFDETYGKLYGEEVKGKKFPFTIVIGSSLQTGLCISLVADSNQVVQINPNPVIEVGKIHTFNENTNKTLKELINIVKKKQAQPQKQKLKQPQQECQKLQKNTIKQSKNNNKNITLAKKLQANRSVSKNKATNTNKKKK